MRGWWNWTVLTLIIALTAFSFVTVWPSEPNRYLPDFVPWPEGQGIKFSMPTIDNATFGLSKVERREMRLGLDLRGGTRLVLAPVAGFQVEDLDGALDGARDVIERRVNAFGVAESEVNRLGADRLVVALPGISAEEAIEKIASTALLQFCIPLLDDAGNVGIVRTGSVVYERQTCEPARDVDGNIILESAITIEGDVQIDVEEGLEVEFAGWPPQGEDFYTRNQIVWTPAKAEIDGVELELTGEYLRPTTSVVGDPVLGLSSPSLVFEWDSTGSDISQEVTALLLAADQMPLAPFMDGEPFLGDDGQVIAPNVVGEISSQGSITGLSLDEAQRLSRLLNTGAFPIPLEVIQQNEVDATLGDSAVRNSVIAGEIALLLIMAFMILYYRLPGVTAALALVVYTSVVLMVFKMWPVTLTLAGIGAFILSVGMAIDANILIFERMKEELRIGRNLIVSLEDGFNRAWSSIRDSNISTLITCAILYWFGNQFDEASIKGFAITLAIGVLISMFSAIIVTRTFMKLAVGYRPIARRLWLFVGDLPEFDRQETRGAPAVAGGASGQASARSEED